MFDWNRIDTVLLDMDGTLLDLYFDNHFWQEYVIRRYAETHRLPLEQAQPEILRRMTDLRGTLDWYCLDFWSRELNLDIRSLKREVDHLIQVHPHAEAFLKSLHGRRPVALVTNAHPDALELKLERTGIGVYFDLIISSHRYRAPKESAAFWEHLRGELAFDPERTLLAEDSLPVLRAARDYGIRHLLAVSRPDSRAGRQRIDGFPSVADFGELLPLDIG